MFLSPGKGVVTILCSKQRNSYGVLVLDSKGYSKMAIPFPQVDTKDFVNSCLSWISLNVFPNSEVYLVEEDNGIRDELLKIESTSPESSNCFRIGVVYCGEDQQTEAEMFQSPPNIKSFNDFLSVIGEEIELEGWGGYRGQLSVTAPGKSYYCQFKGAEIMFHVSTLMDAEQQRRLIGNDTAIIYFHDTDKKPFPTQAPRSVMSQVMVFSSCSLASLFLKVYCVVKPVDGGTKLKAGFMTRKTVAEFGPEMPLNPTFDVMTSAGRELFKSFLLCKVVNGYRSATISPPLDKMLRRPRAVIIEKLCENWPNKSKKRGMTLKVKK